MAAEPKPPAIPPRRPRPGTIRTERRPDGSRHTTIEDSFQQAVGPHDFTADNQALFPEMEALIVRGDATDAVAAARRLESRIKGRGGTQDSRIRKLAARFRVWSGRTCTNH